MSNWRDLEHWRTLSADASFGIAMRLESDLRREMKSREEESELRSQEAADAKFAAEKLRQQLTAANAKLERLQSAVHELEQLLSDTGSERNQFLRERDKARGQALTVNRAWQAFCEDQLDACNDWLEETQTNCAGAGLLFQEEVTTP